MANIDFINKIAPYAVKDAETSGILASVSMAQAILESGWGTTDLAKLANNLFGMKCSLSGNTWESVWDGVSKYTKTTREQKANGEEYFVKADFRAYPDILSSIKDHSLYLLGAMNGKSKRYKGLSGEKDYRKAIQIIKDGGYATDTEYVNKVCSIIEKYELYKYDKKESENMGIKIVDNILKDSPCYKSGRTMTPGGGMLHSVGCPQPDPKVFAKNFSVSTNACVHAVVGVEEVVLQLLPWNQRAWHCGSGPNGSGNNNLISIEMTEPASIKYTGGASWVETGDGSNTKKHVLATYKNAVAFFAYICNKYGFNPENSNVLMSHKEGNAKGIASNHGDPEHIWKKYGLTMDQFRKDVKKAMKGEDVTTVPSTPVDNSSDDKSKQKVNKLDGSVTIIYKGSDGINIRKAPSITAAVDHVEFAGKSFVVVGISADEKWYKLDNGLYITTIPEYVSFKATPAQKESTSGTGYFRVRKSWGDAGSQIGAFKSKDNAVELCKQNSGYKVFDNDGKEVYPCITTPANSSFVFRVTIPDLRIRKGPGTTFDYHKKNGKAVYTGEGSFTIVKTKDGPGAKLWGLLKSYKDNEDGWIALDEDYGVKVK